MLLLLALPLAAGLLLGLARGGALGGLAQLRPRAGFLLGAALALQLADYYAPGFHPALTRLGLPPSVLVLGTAGAWLAANLRGRPRGVRAALAVVLAGWCLNLVPIAANGRMPYSPAAAAQAGIGRAAAAAHAVKNEPASARTAVAWLGDTIPLRPLRKVVSPGDVLLAAGVCLALAEAMRSSAPRPAGATV